MVKFVGEFYLYYTATKAGSASDGGNGHKCIGRAVSENAGGPLRNAGLWHCPAGGRWAIDANSVRYATGIASCGASPLPAARCQPLQDGARRPYFGYNGPGGLDPFATLPGNHTGPGGMDIFNAADGTFRVVYHYWKNNGGPRYPITGFLGRRAGDGFFVS